MSKKTIKVEEKKVEEEPAVVTDLRIVRGLLPSAKGGRGLPGTHWTGVLYGGTQLSVTASAGKYLLSHGGGTATGWGPYLANCSEFGTLDQLYDEVFIRKVVMRYFPRNKYSSNTSASSSAAGSPGNLNTLLATIAFLPHNSPAYTDNASTFFNMAVQQQRKFVNLADNWSFVAVNPEKFDWKAPMQDQSTSAAAQGWCEFSLVSTKYGGYTQIATPAASALSAAVTTLTESGILGDFIVELHISCRARG